MIRAVLFLTATLLLASFGAVAQNTSSPTGGQNASVAASAPDKNATEPAAPAASSVHGSQGVTTVPGSKGIQKTAQGEDTGTGNSSAELPQTSTILPLLGLLGLGSLVAGLFARR
jgi:hypothetical protein